MERAHNQDRDRPEDGQVGCGVVLRCVGCGVVLCQITGDSPCLFTGSGPKSFSFAEFEVFDPTSNELSSGFRIQVPTQNTKRKTQNEFKFQSKTQNTKRIQVPTQNSKHKTNSSSNPKPISMLPDSGFRLRSSTRILLHPWRCPVDIWRVQSFEAGDVFVVNYSCLKNDKWQMINGK